MESKKPFSGDNFEDMLRRQLLEMYVDNPDNKTIMEALSQYVAGSNVFITSSKGAKAYYGILKKLGLLCLFSALVVSGFILIREKAEVKYSSSGPVSRDQNQRLIEIENFQESIQPEDNPEPKKVILPLSGKTINDQGVPSMDKKGQELNGTFVAVKKQTIDLRNNDARSISEGEMIVINQETEFYPNLSPEEIRENHKQKKKIISRLLKKDKSTWVFIPSGKVKLNGEEFSVQAFTMRTTEITNLEYRTFLFDLIIEGRKDEFRKVRPIQATWKKRFKEGQHNAMTDLYFSHPSFNEYPVVNITREGAEMYCKWLSEESAKRMKEQGKVWQHPANIRLPLEAEWVFAASGGRSDIRNSTGTDSLRNKKSCYQANYSCLEEDNAVYDSTLRYFIPVKGKDLRLMDDGGFYMVNVSSYIPNDFGLYCMSGNVSEMIYRISKSGKKRNPGTIGGSWMSPAHYLQFNAPEEWPNEVSGPSPMIGFRPVYIFLNPNENEVK